MFDFFARLFRGEPSGVKAKERLRLVLLSDHLALAPDVVESLRRDLLDVISRYVEVDIEHVDVTFEQRENEVAMLANVPILSVRDERPRRADATPPKVSFVPPAPASAAAASAEPAPLESALDASFWADPIPDAAPAGEEGDAPAAPAAQAPKRVRRRRRKRASAYAPPPPPGDQFTAPPP
jgi:cell division topological specificity factor